MVIFCLLLRSAIVHFILLPPIKSSKKKNQHPHHVNILTQLNAHRTPYRLLYCCTAFGNFIFTFALFLRNLSDFQLNFDYYSPNATTCCSYTLSPLSGAYKHFFYILHQFSALLHCRALPTAGCALRVALTPRRAYPYVWAQPYFNNY
jgi:hypothetical protein